MHVEKVDLEDSEGNKFDLENLGKIAIEKQKNGSWKLFLNGENRGNVIDKDGEVTADETICELVSALAAISGGFLPVAIALHLTKHLHPDNIKTLANVMIYDAIKKQNEKSTIEDLVKELIEHLPDGTVVELLRKYQDDNSKES